MADIEVAIKIPEEEYEMIVNSEDCGLHTLTRAIARGTILPKGHGRIGDLDKLIKRVTNLPKCPNGYSQVYDEAMIINIIEDEPVIIEVESEKYVNFADDLLPIIDEVESEDKEWQK